MFIDDCRYCYSGCERKRVFPLLIVKSSFPTHSHVQNGEGDFLLRLLEIKTMIFSVKYMSYPTSSHKFKLIKKST